MKEHDPRWHAGRGIRFYPISDSRTAATPPVQVRTASLLRELFTPVVVRLRSRGSGQIADRHFSLLRALANASQTPRVPINPTRARLAISLLRQATPELSRPPNARQETRKEARPRCSLSPTRSACPFVFDLQRFANKRFSKLAGPRQRAKLRAAGRRVPWNLSRARATVLIRELAPAPYTQSLVDHALRGLKRRWKFVNYEEQICRRVAAAVRRAQAKGVPADVIEYEAARFAEAFTRRKRGRAGNLEMEQALEGLGLSPDRFFMRGLRY